MIMEKITLTVVPLENVPAGLELVARRSRRRGAGPALRRWRRAFSPVALVLAWQLASSTGLISERTAPAPTAVWRAGAALVEQGDLQEHLTVSLGRVAQGLLLGVSAGAVLALVAGMSRLAEDLVDPPVQIMRTLPILALVPLFIVWFGIGETPKVLMIALAVAFPIYINTLAGIRGVDAKLAEVASTVRLGRARLIREVVLPGALPSFLVGLRFSLAISWLVLVVSEQVNANTGVGYLMMNARTFRQTEIIYVGLVIYGVLGLLSDLLVRGFEARALRWRRGFAGS